LEFNFCRAMSFVMPTGLVARDPREFFAVLPQVAPASLFFHYFESRLRLGKTKKANDFSAWLGDWGLHALVRRMGTLNPYAMTLDELKASLIELGRLEGVN